MWYADSCKNTKEKNYKQNTKNNKGQDWANLYKPEDIIESTLY
jgi:hypothetical protein